jgi:hypothetical protein
MRSQTLKDNFDSRGDRKLLHDSGTNLCSPTTTQVVRFTDKVQRQRPALFRNNSYVREPFRTNPTCPPPPPDPQTTHNPYVTVSPLLHFSKSLDSSSVRPSASSSLPLCSFFPLFPSFRLSISPPSFLLYPLPIYQRLSQNRKPHPRKAHPQSSQ